MSRLLAALRNLVSRSDWQPTDREIVLADIEYIESRRDEHIRAGRMSMARDCQGAIAACRRSIELIEGRTA